MGGNAFAESNRIDRENINSTINAMFVKANISVPYTLLGSVGKKDSSGDIDLAIDDENKDSVILSMSSVFPEKGNKNVKSFLVDVVTPNGDLTGNKIQVDFMFGKRDWLNLFYYYEQGSEFNGASRNIAINALASYTNRQESDETDSMGRPIWVIKYKWSPVTGLTRVKRQSKINSKGTVNLKQEETSLSEPLFCAYSIADILSNKNLSPSFLNSVETILDYLKNYVDVQTKWIIFDKIVSDLNNKSALTEYQLEKLKSLVNLKDYSLLNTKV